MEKLLAGDPCARAWAAGVFDAEGSATQHTPTGRGRPQPELFVYQAGRDSAPPLLEQFRDVVECGSVMGPYRRRLWCWRTGDVRGISRVATSLWPWLGPPKKAQLLSLAGSIPSLWFLGVVAEVWDGLATKEMRSPDPVAVAWAAGLFSGEGYVGAPRRARMHAAVTQASSNGVPDVLTRFHSAVLGIGSITGPYQPSSPWSRLPQYRWSVGSYDGVQAVIALLWRWLDDRKREQARAALRAVRDARAARATSPQAS